MMHNALRSFIRESIMLNESGMLTLPAILASTQTSENILEKDLAGKKFSTIDGGEPEFIVYADNKSLGKCIIKKYTASEAAIDELLKQTRSSKIDRKDPVVNDIIEKSNGWKTRWSTDPDNSATLDKEFKRQLDIANNLVPISVRPGAPVYLKDFYLMSRKPEYLRRPLKRSTEADLQNLVDFKCSLSPEDVVNITLTANVQSYEYAQAASCWYEYAKSPDKQAFFAIVATAAVALVTKNPKFSLSTFFNSAAISEIVFRLPLARWARATGRNDLFWANVAYIAAMALFLGANWAEASEKLRSLLAAGKGGGTAAVKAAEETIKLLNLSGTEAAFFMNKATKDGLWPAILYFIIELVTVSLPFLGVENLTEADAEKLRRYFENPDSVTTELTSSQKDFSEFLNKYPRF